MTKLLLSIHVIAAILAIGPIAVAASLFPRYARQSASNHSAQSTQSASARPEGSDAQRATAVAALLHRICRGYALVGIAVPLFGVATAAQLGVLTDVWLIASIVLTTVAVLVLALAIIPAQGGLLTAPEDTATNGNSAVAARLAMLTGVFNLLWAIVVVLMIVRPGSTTGA
ncbi:hypothetical protein [Streptomyces rapamycinicus]|uniref:Integral membrane protein n=2 Tax=Streptomyces rapamycinicus TaxID=1226757 RepID=A0A0A0NWW2_STRRN|nr:hypothetical protein [Streptomyces rapamycinicus]AGP60475.1 hypothetical protein M271_45545 [Streptomyces rapamycinicus NRRL 5491]MBB4788361.1 hypothetical protein [Streptomyces rapamycinicus]RLV72696.1 hypothetical protein D3C57_149255 [Streptomyces rapamycinicus NRRL 5491]UTP36038.1 hypothetical protein LIV37_46280 [Streptomyces rapamycinicus NRRL 5491]